MKKLILTVLVIGMLFTFGCSKEWLAHDTVYKTNAHMVFSWWGYNSPDAEDMKDQIDQDGWWGEEIPYLGE